MKTKDNFSEYYAGLLEGQYDCVDRIVVNGYFRLGHSAGGFRNWWRQLWGNDATLDDKHIQGMAGDFGRRVNGFAKKRGIPVVYCKAGERKHLIAEQYIPKDKNFQGLFLILVGRAPGLVWKVKKTATGALHLKTQKPWPYINHYHFHLIDKEWGHVTIKMCGYPPFAVQVMLNGHEWVERKVRRKTISQKIEREGNCFVGGSIQAVDEVARHLCNEDIAKRIQAVCDRWVYSACLCFGLSREQQRSSGFHYQYSCYQIEYSRNLLFQRGTVLDEVYQGMIDRTRVLLNVEKLKTVFGRKYRPQIKHGCGRLERVLDASQYDLTVFKLHFGKLTLKVYDKGARVLRIEAIAHNVKDLQCGKCLEKLSTMLLKLQRMTVEFLNVLQAAEITSISVEALDSLPQPVDTGARRLAGVDLQKPRVRAVAEALIALAPQPGGFTAGDLADKIGNRPEFSGYTRRQAAYDLRKFRGKQIVGRKPHSCHYQIEVPNIRLIAGLLLLRDKVVRPLLAGFGRPHPGRPRNHTAQLDVHYRKLQYEMWQTFKTLKLAA